MTRIGAICFVALCASVYAAETNGRGGGAWGEGITWKSGKPPGAREAAKVAAGDTVVIAPGKDARCGGLVIDAGGVVQFDPAGGQLTSAGDVDVKGSLFMGPESELRIDCAKRMQYGVFVNPDGAFFARGSHPFARNCVIRAARGGGKHNTFVRFERGARGSLRFCELSYLGGKPKKGGRNRLSSGVFFWVGITVEGCHFHHCYTALHLITGGRITVRHNLFTDNRVGLTLYRPTNATVTGNRFVRNGIGLMTAGKHTQASGHVHGNLFEKNRTGLSLFGLLGPSSFYDNVYHGNTVGLLLRSANAPIAREHFAANRCAVELAPGTVGARLVEANFGLFQGERVPNKDADVRVASPGPSGITLDACRFATGARVAFAPDAKGKPGGKRWVLSQNHNGVGGDTKRWDAATSGKQKKGVRR